MRYYYNTYDPVWGLNNIVNDLFDTWSDNGRRLMYMRQTMPMS